MHFPSPSQSRVSLSLHCNCSCRFSFTFGQLLRHPWQHLARLFIWLLRLTFSVLRLRAQVCSVLATTHGSWLHSSWLMAKAQCTHFLAAFRLWIWIANLNLNFKSCCCCFVAVSYFLFCRFSNVRCYNQIRISACPRPAKRLTTITTTQAAATTATTVAAATQRAQQQRQQQQQQQRELQQQKQLTMSGAFICPLPASKRTEPNRTGPSTSLSPATTPHLHPTCHCPPPKAPPAPLPTNSESPLLPPKIWVPNVAVATAKCTLQFCWLLCHLLLLLHLCFYPSLGVV